MLKKSLLAFVERDLQLSKDVLYLGQSIDQLTEVISSSQMALIKKKPEQVEQRVSLLKVCRQLERIADHATNISEDVIFSMSGDIIRHGGNG